MPLFQPPDSVLDLPTKDDISDIVESASTKYTNYSTASGVTKINEAATRLSHSGELSKFGTLSKGIQLTQDDTDVYATDAATGEPLSESLQKRSDMKVDPSIGSSGNQPQDDKTIRQRVKISQLPKVGQIQEVEFLNMPTIQETRDVQYKPADIAHHPGEILKYVNTGARSWTIAVKLTSRNISEATLNLNYINVIRSWMMPFYGTGNSDPNLQQYLGAPPPILTLSAYGAQMIGPVPCVLTNYSWTFPNDCDYIPAGDPAEYSPFPVILDINLTLKESFSPAEYSSFDLSSYKEGNMQAAFSGGGVFSNIERKSSPAEFARQADEARNMAQSSNTRTNSDINEQPAWLKTAYKPKTFTG